MKPPTPQQLARAKKAVLAAARAYGDKAAVADYSDAEEAKLLGTSYKYAELLRRKAAAKKV